MDYILDGIKTIFEYSYFIIILGTIYWLMKLYKEREENENLLALKLIGFCILGTININTNNFYMMLVIPIGYGIYHFFIKPKDSINKEIKNNSAKLGLIALGVSIVCGLFYNGLEYRYRYVKTSNNSIKGIEEDYRLIAEKLKLEDYITPIDFRLTYDKDNNIENISYSFISGDKTYYASKWQEDDRYSITVSKYNEPDLEEYNYWNDDESVEESKIEMIPFLKAVENIKFDMRKSDREIVSYYLSYDKNKSKTGSEQGINGDKIYYIDDYEKYTYKEARKRELPISGDIIMFSPMVEMPNNTEHSYGTEGIYTDMYVLNPMKHQNLIKEDASYLKVNDLINNKNQTLDSEEDYDGFNNILSSFDFGSWEEQEENFNMTGEVTFTIKDDKGVTLEFYKNQEYVKYKSKDEEVIYKISKETYEEIVNNIL
ncbi:MAG: hypothetical protein ACRDD7_08535 [Peptostreptococcaceae bacterium]